MTEPPKGWTEKPVQMRTTAPNEDLAYCVFLIERGLEGGGHRPRGSGFLVNVDSILYAVTARHVVQQQDEKTGEWTEIIKPLFVRAVRDNEDGTHSSFLKEFASRFFSYDDMFVFHADASVDAAVFPTYRLVGVREKTKALPTSFLQPDDLVRVGEDVHLFGFPGPYGCAEGMSVVRSGTICFKLDRYKYLLDATAWPGDSGGLVCSKPYFGVPEDHSGQFQWQMGGKIIGLHRGREPASRFGLPAELEAFRLVVSAQAVSEILESEAFASLHARIRAVEAADLPRGEPTAAC